MPRPRLELFGKIAELPGRKSVLYPFPEGNLTILGDWLGVDVPDGNLVGFFPADLEDDALQEKVLAIGSQEIPIEIGFQDGVTIWAPTQKLLEALVSYAPEKMNIEVFPPLEGRIWLQGQTIQRVIHDLDILCEKREDGLILWR